MYGFIKAHKPRNLTQVSDFAVRDVEYPSTYLNAADFQGHRRCASALKFRSLILQSKLTANTLDKMLSPREFIIL